MVSQKLCSMSKDANRDSTWDTKANTAKLTEQK